MIEEALTHSSLATFTQFYLMGKLETMPVSFHASLSSQRPTSSQDRAIASGQGLPLEFTMRNIKKKKNKKKHKFSLSLSDKSGWKRIHTVLSLLGELIQLCLHTPKEVPHLWQQDQMRSKEAENQPSNQFSELANNTMWGSSAFSLTPFLEASFTDCLKSTAVLGVEGLLGIEAELLF